LRDNFVRHAQESALEELLENLPVSEHEEARAHWFGYVRAQGDGVDAERDFLGSDFSRM
jgi:hypothetical protein